MQVVPCYEGNHNPRTIINNNFVGCDLIEWLQTNLEQRGCYFTTSEEKEILREIIEKHGYVAIDYDKEIQKAKSSSACDSVYMFTDDESICLSDERFSCPEIFFKPQLNGFEFDIENIGM